MGLLGRDAIEGEGDAHARMRLVPPPLGPELDGHGAHDLAAEALVAAPAREVAAGTVVLDGEMETPPSAGASETRI